MKGKFVGLFKGHFPRSEDQTVPSLLFSNDELCEIIPLESDASQTALLKEGNEIEDSPKSRNLVEENYLCGGVSLESGSTLAPVDGWIRAIPWFARNTATEIDNSHDQRDESAGITLWDEFASVNGSDQPDARHPLLNPRTVMHRPNHTLAAHGNFLPLVIIVLAKTFVQMCRMVRYNWRLFRATVRTKI